MSVSQTFFTAFSNVHLSNITLSCVDALKGIIDGTPFCNPLARIRLHLIIAVNVIFQYIYFSAKSISNAAFNPPSLIPIESA